jgi:hypothetical protein
MVRIDNRACFETNGAINVFTVQYTVLYRTLKLQPSSHGQKTVVFLKMVLFRTCVVRKTLSIR